MYNIGVRIIQLIKQKFRNKNLTSPDFDFYQVQDYVMKNIYVFIITG